MTTPDNPPAVSEGRTESADDALLREALAEKVPQWIEELSTACISPRQEVVANRASAMDHLWERIDAYLSRPRALEEAAIRRAAAAVQNVWQTYSLPVGPKMFRAMALAALKGQKP